MSFLKKSILFLNKLHLLIKNEPIIVFDIGARGSLVEPWFTLQLKYPSVIKVYGFEPDQVEYENLISSNNKINYFPFALWNKDEEILLNIAIDKSSYFKCSSSKF